MSNTERYLWYACYGSNLRAERFEIYLTGGSLRINDHTVTEKAAVISGRLKLPKLLGSLIVWCLPDSSKSGRTRARRSSI